MANSKKAKNRRGANVSPLDGHHREGKRLIPPLMRMRSVQLSSWYNDRLPNILWAALLATMLKRESALDHFRSVLGKAQRLGKDRIPSIDHSDLADMGDAVFDELFGDVLRDAEARHALAPLAGLHRIPDRHHWLRHLVEPEDIGSPLANTIAETFDHQSQASTDCRWLRLMILVVTDRMVFNSEMQERVEELFEYPSRGDQSFVRPFIRAGEMGLGNDKDNKPEWPAAFWAECWERSNCMIVPKARFRGTGAATSGNDVLELYAKVGEYAALKEGGTGIDPRHNATFGLVMYALALSAPVLKSGAHTRAEGRLVLRSLVESYVTLEYLLREDRGERWVKYRQHGSGQAKLAYLKLYDLSDKELPEYVSVETLESYANEDIWQEFMEIDVGNWMGKDLRSTAESLGVKDVYDKYYIWPSSYAHAQWSSVREVVFDQCFNPLHRFHRVPAEPNFSLPSVASDMVKLLNLHLECLNRAYPGFGARMKSPPISSSDEDGMQSS